MGLAASQARLLMLTSRRDTVEGKLMSVANEKLSLSRESADISREYNDALNAQSLTWTTKSSDVDLSYNLLMKSNSTNTSGQYLITNAQNNRVILDSDYINKLGIAQSGNAGDIASMSKEDFLIKMIGCTQDSAKAYVASCAPGSVTTGASASSFTVNYDDDTVIKNSGLVVYNANQLPLGDDKASAFTNYLDNVAQNLQTELMSEFSDYLGTNSTVQAKLNQAFEEAYQQTYNKFIYNTQNGTVGSELQNLSGSSNGTNQIHNGYIDGSQLIDTYLTYFDVALASLAGGKTSSAVGQNKTTRSTTGGTGTETTDLVTSQTQSTQYTIDIDNNNISDIYDAKFYLNVYDALNSFGWQTTNDVDDKNFLENQVLNGNINIMQFQESDSTWTNTTIGGIDSPLNKTTKDDVATKAEVKYEANKALLDAKEQKLDLKQKSLDTERSSIVQEIDSVSNLIKKNIEKSFKIFDA